MAAYEYVALSDRGATRKGVLEGDSGRHVRQLLRERGLTPVEVTATHTSDAGPLTLRWRQRISGVELALLTRQIATIVGAGLSIEESLLAVAQQSASRRATAVFMTVRGSVMQGQSFSSALAEFPGSFSAMYRATVAAGEHSGHLDKVLENLANYLERAFETRRNVEMALFYPIILFICAVAIVILLMTFVIPDIVEVFDTSGATLPTVTTVLISVSDALRNYGWYMLAGLAGLIIVVQLLLRTSRVRLRWDGFKLRIPLVRWLVRTSSTSRYASTLAILGQSGVPLVESMRIAGEIVTNTWIKTGLGEAVTKVTEGSSLRNALEASGNFPPIFLHMIASGETSGMLDELLTKAAEFQQRELERRVETVVQLFRPLMLLVMAGMVLIIMLGMLLPILNMNELIL